MIIGVVIAGIAMLAGSLTLLSRFGPSLVAPETNPKIRLALFIAWTLLAPFVFLLEWHVFQYRPPAGELMAFTYGRKVISDLWAAIAIALGLLWGIRR